MLKNNRNNKIIGLLFVVVGILTLLLFTGVINYLFIDYLCTFVLILAGIHLFSSDLYLIGTYAFALAIWFYPSRLPLRLHTLGIFRLFIVASFVGLGLFFILEDKVNNINDESITGNNLRITNKFKTVSKYIYGDQVSRIYLSSSFGNLHVNLKDIKLQQDLHIQVNINCGHIELYMPEEWNIKENCSLFLGDVKEAANITNSEYSVYITGNVNIGQLIIHYI